jgi:tetratricopeptide (TPR) repeat protein
MIDATYFAPNRVTKNSEALMRNTCALLFVVMHIAGFGRAATAQTLDQQQQCPGADPDLSISGCTAMIESGHETQQRLPVDFYNRGIAYAAKDQYDRAIEDFDHAIRLNPNDAGAFVARGRAYALKDQYDRAIEDFDHAIRLSPFDARAFVVRGIAYAAKNQYDHAIEDYDRAIRLNPNDARAFVFRGGAYFGRGLIACRPLPPCALAIAQYDRAIEDFDQAIRLNPNDAAATLAYWQRSIIKSAKGDSAGAAADLAKAQQLSSSVGK